MTNEKDKSNYTSGNDPKSNFPIRWKAKEQKYSKNSDWYWYIASAALLTVIISIFLKNFLFGVLGVLAGMVLMMTGSKKAESIRYEINTKGILTNSELHPYRDIESFWIIYEPPFQKDLLVKFKKRFIKYMKIPLTDTDPTVIRRALTNIIPEKQSEESFLDIIAEWMGL